MRNILGTQSYMDTLLPNEIEIEIYEKEEEKKLNKDDLEEYYYNLEEYCKLYQITEKWHKYKTKVQINPIRILPKNEKREIPTEQLEKYFRQLKEYYQATKSQEKNRKIIRLSNKLEENLTDDEYAIYLKQLRIHDDSSKVSNLSLKERKRIAPFLRILMKGSRIASRIKIYKLNQKVPKIPNDRPIIFVLTHVGKDDQIVFSDIIKEHYTILSGDYESLHNKIEGNICKINGIKFFDMRSQKERNEIGKKVEETLKEGDNILCSMEAAWNLYPNVPVTELFKGMIHSAINANAVIVPVGIERFSKTRYGINVGEEVFDPLTYVEKFQTEEEMVNVAKDDLRQILANLKMKLYFHKKIAKKIKATRESIGDYEEYNKKFKEDILTGWTFTEEAIKEKRYHSKEEPINAFSYLITKYSNLTPLYESIKDDTIPVEIKEKIIKKFKKLLVELSNDISNPIYPNDIHNELQKQFEDILLIINNDIDVSNKVDVKQNRKK